MAKYKDKENIGSGGFGEVWECERVEANKVFAKKKLQTDINVKFRIS